MKKFIPILMLVCLLCSFAACGQQEAAVAIVTPEPVAQSGDPTGTSQIDVPDVAPADRTEQETTAEENTDRDDGDQDHRNDTSTTTTGSDYSGSYTDSGNNSGNSGDALSIAQSYIGSSIGALQSAIGAPNSSEYVVSCLEDGLYDGILYYDGFMVWTIQYTDGSEIVKGVA